MVGRGTVKGKVGTAYGKKKQISRTVRWGVHKKGHVLGAREIKKKNLTIPRSMGTHRNQFRPRSDGGGGAARKKGSKASWGGKKNQYRVAHEPKGRNGWTSTEKRKKRCITWPRGKPIDRSKKDKKLAFVEDVQRKKNDTGTKGPVKNKSAPRENTNLQRGEGEVIARQSNETQT